MKDLIKKIILLIIIILFLQLILFIFKTKHNVNYIVVNNKGKLDLIERIQEKTSQEQDVGR